ncbi:hypothetical protein [Alicyclobacillus sp. ALC3]|nr:hypothetical protein [Alicyclobacillus sp. ALC3]
MQGRANRGLSSVVWVTVITIIVLFALAAIFWWYDAEWLHHA